VLGCRGTLIGVTPDPQLEECVVELDEGDVVALYTDGVTEASHSRPLDSDDILAALHGCRTADAVADGLQGLARLDGAPARDDVAILTLQVA
jgi:serine phosphatase RsbU (regulator of sigma subunit)